MTVLARELLACYEANKSGNAIELPVAPAHYSDYVRWQTGDAGWRSREKSSGSTGGTNSAVFPRWTCPPTVPRITSPNLPRRLAHLVMERRSLSKRLKPLRRNTAQLPS